MRLAPSLAFLSAATPRGLRVAAAWLLERAGPLDAATRLQAGEGRHRAVVVGADEEGLREGLRALASGEVHPGMALGEVGEVPPRVGFLLTGEGSERAGAGRGLCASDAVFAEAARAALQGVGHPELAGLDADLCQWRDLHLGKLLLGALDLGLAAALRARGVEPVVVCGHSVGEYPAAALAGSVDEADAMRLLDDLGRRLEESPVRGGMALARGASARVQALLAETPEVGLAVDNAPDWVALWGSPGGLQRGRERLREAGVSTRGMPVPRPMHGPLVAGIAEEVVRFARQLGHAPPARTWVSTVEAAPLTALDADYWGEAMTRPVRFREAWAAARALPVDLWVELGPKPGLSLFIEDDASVLAALDPRLDDAVAFARLLGWLWCHGQPLEEVEAARLLEVPEFAEEIEEPEHPPLSAARLLELLQAGAAGVLGLPEPGGVDVDQPLPAMGLDSLMAFELRNRVMSISGERLSVVDLLTAPGLRSVADTHTRRARARASASSLESGTLPALTAGHPTEHEASPGQARLAFLQETLPPETYNVHVGLKVHKELDPERLRAALRWLILRHEQLRVALVTRDGALEQRVLPAVDPPLRVHDWRHLEGAADRLLALSAAQARAPFALHEAPLFRLSLVCLPGAASALLLTGHHAISDGQSTAVFLRELSEVYEALERGEATEPTPTASYVRYSALHRAWVAQAEPLRQWWRGHLEGVRRLELPADRPPPPTPSGRGGEQHFTLPVALSDALDGLARRQCWTPFVVLLAAWVTLLHRLSGARHFPVAVITSGRPRADLADVIGLFVRTLPLHVSAEPEESALSLMRRLRTASLQMMEHEALPLLEVLSLAPPEHRDALLRVSFVLESERWTTRRFAGAPTTSLTRSVSGEVAGTAKFDLGLAMVRTPEGYQASLQYSSDLFDAQTVVRWAGHLETLLRGLVEAPERRLSELPLLSEAERHQLLVEWNDTAAPVPELPIHALFEQQVQRRPEATALVFEEQSLSYAALNARANQLAWHLRGLGVGLEARVGILLERSIELVVAVLAVLKAGGAYVPLDPSYPEARLRFMAEDAGLAALITTSELALDVNVPRVEVDLIDLSENPAADLGVRVRPANLAYVIYTSGSTGRPKGILTPHRGVVRLVHQPNYAQMDEHEVFLQLAPMSFDASTLELWGPLLNGGRLVLAPPGPVDVPRLGALLRAQGVTTLWLTAALFQAVVDEDVGCLRPLRQLLAGGDVLSPPHVARAARRLPDTQLINGYGPTESTTFACCHPIPQAGVEGSIPLGRPISNTRVHVLDAGGAPTPIGVPGELHISGVGLARGYLGRPGLTAERFVPDPFGPPGSRMYRTGDLCRWRPDGNLEFLGRLDHQVKVRGYRIELGEIEAALLSQPGVSQCVVVAREGQGGKRLVAYVVGEGSLEIPALRASLQSRLPEWMVPSAFVVLEALPLSPNGKVDRRALPEPTFEGAREERVAPRTEAESRLAALWSGVLGVAQVSVTDDFFALGGHSLLLTQLASRVRAELGVEVPLRALFEARTLEAQALCVQSAQASELAPLVAVARDQRLPQSFAQARLWFLEQLNPGTAEYNVPMGFALRGPVDVDALRAAIQEIVSRHEVLRTTLGQDTHGPVQHIGRPEAWGWRFLEVDSEEEAERLLAEEASRPFDLERGPVFRVTLLRLGEAEHRLLLNVHHAAFDGASMGVLQRELSVACAGRASELPDLPLQIVDLAAWERRALSGEALEAKLAPWRTRLADAPTLELPTDRPRPPMRDVAGAVEPVRVSAEVLAGLDALALRTRCTRFMVLLAAFQLLLSRLSGQEDVVVGAPVAGRTRAEVEPLIGLFVNTLALRTDLSGDPSFMELLGRVREVVLFATSHQDVPFEQLVDAVVAERDTSRTPLVQAMFALEEPARWPEALGEAALEPIELSTGIAKFDLSLFMRVTERGLEGGLEYATALLDAQTVVRWACHLETLLRGLVEAPERRLSELPLLSEAERHQLLVEWNDTAAPVPELPIHALFEQQVQRRPEATALVFEEQSLSYAALNARANQLAWHLRGLGVGLEARVGILLERSIELVVAVLAVLKAGGAYVPLDPSYPEARLRFMAADAGLAALITTSELALDVNARRVDLDLIDLSENPAADLGVRVRPANLAYVIYTSGSTGRPKGILTPHRGVVRLVHQPNYAQMDEHEVFLQLAPMSFDASTLELWGPLLNGGRLVLAPPGPVDVPRLGALLRAQGVTTLWLTAALFQAVVDEDVGCLRPLRQLLAGGDVLSPPHVARAARRLPDTQLINGYGPTESTTFACCHPIPQAGVEGSIPLGRPISNTQVHVLDAGGAPAPIGVPGELHISGVGLARGYLGRPGLTAERFVPDPFGVPGSRMYRTGDLCRWRPDGNLEFLGRLDHQVKVRGYRIELGEIEAALLSQPGVSQCVVVAREGQGGKRLVAYVVGEGSLETSALRASLQSRLPEWMVPSAFVVLEALPLSPNGKVDRRALPEPTFEGAREDRLAPRTALEARLAALWSELLGVEVLSVTDDFFSLGGHSLMATVLLARVAGWGGSPPSLAGFLRAPTIAGLAVQLDPDGRLDPFAALLRPRQAGEPPCASLSGAERRLWFLERLFPDARSYQVPALLRLRGAVTRSALRESLAQVARAHEILRTTYPEVDGEPRREVSPTPEIPWQIEDLSAHPEPEAALRSLVESEVARPFDLANGPLTRVLLVRLSDDEHRLLLHQHHILTDEWSSALLLREWSEAYEALREGRASAPDAPALQLADYARAEVEAQRGEALGLARAYWKEQLHALPRLDLPLLNPGDGEAPGLERTLSIRLGGARSEALRALCRAESATHFMAWVAVFSALLARYSGQTDFGLGSVVANRRPETQRLLGFFTNTVVLRADLRGDPSFRALLGRCRQAVLDMLHHQALPFDVVVADQGVARRAGETPFYDVSVFEATDLRVDGAHLEPAPEGLDLAPMGAKDPLALAVVQADGGTVLHLQYDASRLDEALVARLADHLCRLLDAALACPDAPLSTLELLSPEELRTLEAWSHTGPPEASALLVRERFERQVTATPEAVALVFGRQRVSYRDLDAAANRLAWELRALGVGPERRVGLCLKRSVALVVGLLAILKAGGAYVPLDPDQPPRRLEGLVSDAGLTLLLAGDPQLEAHLGARVPTLRLDAEVPPWKDLPDHAPEASGHPQSAMMVVYTSGSTGRPKGVVVQRASVAALLAEPQVRQRYAAPCVALQRAKPIFDTLAIELLGPLCAGGQVVLLPPASDADPAAVAAAVRRHAVSYVDVPPTLLRWLLEEPDFCEAPSLRLVNVGGEALSTELAERFGHRCSAALWNAYGPTEATVEVTLATVDTRRGAPVRIGRPLAGVHVHVLGPWGERLPPGLPGELVIGGPGLARGYLDRPGLTAARFRPDPFSSEPGARLYHTGDRARWDERGQLEFLGRLDHQVKVRGYRVELGEVEHALASFPGVQATAALADEGPGASLIAAVVAPPDTTQAALRAHLRERLPDYMVPGVFLVLEALPLTPAGKVDRRALLAAAGAAQGGRLPYEAPRTPRERLLAELWANLLGHERVGIHDDFFALGGDSILSLRVVALAARAGITLTAQEIFAAPTIAALCADVDPGARGPAVDLEAEAQLPADLSFSGAAQPRRDGILLTGATGFLGAQVLRRLLEPGDRRVYCLVRAATLEDARARLERERLPPEASAWLVPVPGDLTKPRFGLSEEAFAELAEEVSVVVHCGAEVNHVAAYDHLKAANVLGTDTAMRLCALSGARLQHISTTDVIPYVRAAERGEGAAAPSASAGYAASKWVAEQRVRAAAARGLRATVIRVGLVGGDADEGALPLRKYWLSQALWLRLALGVAPERRLSFLPSDLVADFIARDARDACAPSAVYDLIPPGLSVEAEVALLERVTGRGRAAPTAEWRALTQGYLRSSEAGAGRLDLLWSMVSRSGAEVGGVADDSLAEPPRARAAALGLSWPDDPTPWVEATLRFVQRSAGAGEATPGARRRLPVNVEELRALLAELEALEAAFPPPSLSARPSDVFIATFPKCGTTWLQQIVHGLRSQGDMDFPEISYVVPFLERASPLGVDLNAAQVATPRAFKTHLPWSQLPRGGRIITVMRDPRDALLSAWRFLEGWYFERGALDAWAWSQEMFFAFEREEAGYWRYLRVAWEQRRRPDVLLLCYEDMLEDLESAVRRVAAFIGVQADEALISLATHQASYAFMRAHRDQFDERQGVARTAALIGLPAGVETTKVREGRAGAGRATLDPRVLARLDEVWQREITPTIGAASYEELRRWLHAEVRGEPGKLSGRPHRPQPPRP
ncbi:MAG: amino acid adenylation domain-containing protein [Alphaproteobacteria bacterium]|nr:amino acid adenylation domain-containing protein [Alphaproteobacteria bacterium]